MWWVILICASGVSCGITHPIAKQTSAESVEQCQQVGELAIDLARYDRTEFRIVCAKAAD